MSIESQEDQTAAADGQGAQALEEEDQEGREEGMEKDPLLALLGFLASKGASLGVTLGVSGAVVSGNLVSASAWYGAFPDMSQALGDDLQRAIGRLQEFDPAPDHPRVPTYLYLLQARILSGSLVPTDPGSSLLMRVRTADVSAVALGVLEPSVR